MEKQERRKREVEEKTNVKHQNIPNLLTLCMTTMKVIAALTIECATGSTLLQLVVLLKEHRDPHITEGQLRLPGRMVCSRSHVS